VQAAGGTLENDAQLAALLDAVDFPEPEQSDNRRGNDRKRGGSDQSGLLARAFI